MNLIFVGLSDALVYIAKYVFWVNYLTQIFKNSVAD